MELKFSIITVSLNSGRTIAGTINSVLRQKFADIEYIIIDGGSSDESMTIIKEFGGRIGKLISEPDKGIYDAINKGIKMATGDVIGIVNSDDMLCSDDVISRIAVLFDDDTDAVYGDVQFIDNKGKILRYYSSGRFEPMKFKYGFMPAHPGFYARKELFEKFGYYKTDYKIAADYELLIRFMYVNRIRAKYIGMPVVNMRMGGVSTRNIFSNITLNREIIRGCRENGINTNVFLVYSKYFRKVFELFVKNKS